MWILPSFCPVLTIPGHSEHIAITYDAHVEAALRLHLSKLTLNRNGEDYWRPYALLELIGKDLKECAAKAQQAGVANDVATGIVHSDLVGLVLTLLLYLAGEPDIVKLAHPGEKPLKPKLARTNPERYRDLSEPKIRAIGGNFARAIERWEIEHRNDQGVATGRTVRPHMRRAHSHLYWTGAGRKQPRVRFLLPISVHGGKLVEKSEHLLETKVR